jgi:DNA-binding NarL/FixJ family response regulator
MQSLPQMNPGIFNKLLDRTMANRLTIAALEQAIALANDAGALEYVVKSRMITELVPAIREALAGHIFISYHPAGRYH